MSTTFTISFKNILAVYARMFSIINGFIIIIGGFAEQYYVLKT